METSMIRDETEFRRRDFEDIAIPHMNSLYRFALYMSGNRSDAEDLLQDTYMKAYRSFDSFRKGTDCKAWLFRIMRNTFINKFRRDKKRPTMIQISDTESGDIEIPVEISPEDEIAESEFGDEVYHAVTRIPDIYRTVVLLADVEEFTCKEIASMIGRPVGTVLSRLHRGRRMLRNYLEEYAVQYGYATA